MSNPLKELLERLGVNLDPALSGKTQQITLSQLQEELQKIPMKEDPDQKLIEFVLDELRGAARVMIKDAKRRELELQIRLLDKPDNVDVTSDKWKHVAQIIEEEELHVDIDKRKGESFLRFADLMASRWMEN